MTALTKENTFCTDFLHLLETSVEFVSVAYFYQFLATFKMRRAAFSKLFFKPVDKVLEIVTESVTVIYYMQDKS